MNRKEIEVGVVETSIYSMYLSLTTGNCPFNMPETANINLVLRHMNRDLKWVNCIQCGSRK